jgi:hypothetical protein
VRTRLALLAGQATLLGLSVAFLVVPASALFLARYGARDLPFVYLAVAVFGVLASAVLRRLQSRLTLASAAAWTVAAFVVLVTVGFVLLRVFHAAWVCAPLVVLFPVSIPVGFVLIGSQAGRLFDVRAMKKYFARVVAGFSVGFAVGGAAAAGLTGPLGGPADLFLVDAAIGAAFLITILATGRRFPEELGRGATRPGPARALPGERARGLRAQGLVATIFGYQLLSAAVTQLLDYMVWERAAARYPQPSDLARFQGLFGAAINVAALVFVAVAAGRLLVRFGVRGGLAANPLGVLLLLVLSGVVGYAYGPAAWAFFALVCAQQIVDIALTDGMTRASINTTYQALDAQLRLRAQTVVEAAGVPIALGFVGGLLLLFRAVHLDVRAVGVVTLALSVLWLVVGLRAYRGYRAGVRTLVTSRPWEPRDVSTSEDDTAVAALLESADARDVTVALGAVRDSGRAAVFELAALLADPDPEARFPAVCELIRRGGPGAADARRAWLAAVSAGTWAEREAALAACSLAADPFFVPHLLQALSVPPRSAALADALARHATALEPVAAAALGTADLSPSARDMLIWSLGEIRNQLPAAPSGLQPAVLRAELEILAARVAHALCATDCFDHLDGAPGLAPLRRALGEDVTWSAQRVADFLAIFHGRRHIEQVVTALCGSTAGDHALAVELLELLEGRETAGLLVALLDPSLDRAARREALARLPTPQWSAREWLLDLIADGEARWQDPWLRACALYAAPDVLGNDAPGVARPWVDDGDVVVAETARWASRPDRRAVV